MFNKDTEEIKSKKVEEIIEEKINDLKDTEDNNSDENKYSNKKKKIFNIDNNPNLAVAVAPLRETFRFVWKHKLIISFLLITLIIVHSVAFAHNSVLKASALVTLNYEESSQGLYPNKTRLNMNDIKSDSVLELAIKNTGIEGEITTGELKKCVSISPTSVKGISTSSEKFYIATSYNISLNLTRNISGTKTSDLLKMICLAYNDVFYQNYATNRCILTFDADTTNMEYYEIADLLKTKASQIKKYISMRTDISSEYDDDASLKTFKNLSQKIDDFVNYDIEKYNSYIIQNGVVKDYSQCKQTLEYKTLMQQQTYDRYMASYKANTDGINIYNVAMSAIVMIPTKDSTEDFYMSKTNSEIDYLAKNADTNLASANSTLLKIEKYKNVISSIKEDCTEESKKQTDEMIDTMVESLNKIAKDVVNTDEVYVKHTMNNYITFRYNGTSFLQIIEFKKSIEICAILFVTMLGLVYITISLKLFRKRIIKDY